MQNLTILSDRPNTIKWKWSLYLKNLWQVKSEEWNIFEENERDMKKLKQKLKVQ